MTTISTPMPRLDLTRIPAANSQRPAHISRSAFLTRLPRSPSPSHGLQLDIDMDGTNNNTDTGMDTFDAENSTSEFPNTFGSSSSATPATSKRVRAASDEDSSGTKRARLDNDTSNRDNDTTPNLNVPKEKKIPQFAVGYVSGGKPKAADYEDIVQALLLRAMQIGRASCRERV